MAMLDTYLNLTASAGAAAITHLGLVDETGTEIAGGSYARQPVTWSAPSSGLIQPTTDKAFPIPADTTVAGWRGFNQLATAGSINYGGADLPAQPFTTAGVYTLLAASTAIDHNVG